MTPKLTFKAVPQFLKNKLRFHTFLFVWSIDVACTPSLSLLTDGSALCCCCWQRCCVWESCNRTLRQVVGWSQVSVPWPHSAVSLSSLLATLMPADRKQLLAPAGSAVVSAGSIRPRGQGGRVNITPPSPPPIPSLPKANAAPLGFCCMMGYIQLLRSAGLEECCGCAPSHRLVSGARRDIKAPSRRGREGGRRGLRGSCLIGQRRGALSLSHGWWLIYHSTGEVRPHRPPHPAHHTRTHTHMFNTHTSLTDSPYCSPSPQCFNYPEHQCAFSTV